MSASHKICWVQRAGGTRLFFLPAPVRWTEHGVVWWWAPPLRSAQRGGLRTTLTACDATGCPMGARKVGASGRAQPKGLDGRIGDRPPAMTMTRRTAPPVVSPVTADWLLYVLRAGHGRRTSGGW